MIAFFIGETFPCESEKIKISSKKRHTLSSSPHILKVNLISGVFMEIRPEILERLLAESDERLWETIRRVGVMNNVSLPASPPPKAEMDQLRGILRAGSLNYEEAVGILSRYKEGEKT